MLTQQVQGVSPEKLVCIKDVSLALYQPVIDVDGVSFGHICLEQSIKEADFLYWIAQFQCPVRLVIHCDRASYFLRSNWLSVAKNVVGLSYYRVALSEQQHPFLSHALSATMRETMQGEYVLLISADSLHGFRDVAELHEAFVRLVQYFGSTIGSNLTIKKVE